MADTFGIYVHWPFCAAKCPYCDFNSHVAARIDQAAWADAYDHVLTRYATEMPGRRVTSVFFGGGTPSLMAPEVVGRVLERIAALWAVDADAEVTLEANPTSVEAGRFRGYRAAGVGRVSLGVQALRDGDLRRLGRLHTAAEALTAMATAREIFARISIDLIYARQDQGLAAWQAELDAALAFDLDHLSLYQLTIEPGTAFGARHAAGRLPGLPDEDLAADLYDWTQARCAAAGLPAYEVSNHARPGAESRHNMVYWTGGAYLGVGPGAHGRVPIDGTRWATDGIAAPGAWLADVQAGGVGERERTALSPRDMAVERALMGLRLRDGVAEDAVAQALDPHGVDEMLTAGMVARAAGRLHLTEAGRPLLNAVLREIVA